MRVRYLKPHGSTFVEQLLEVELSPDSEVSTAWRLGSFRELDMKSSTGTEPWLHCGLFDSHLHVSWVGEIERRIVGPSFDHLDDYVEALAKSLSSTPEDETLVSYGFDEDRWGVSKETFVARVQAALDPGRRWILYRICGHSALASPELLTCRGLTVTSALLDDTLIHALQQRMPLPPRETVKQDFLRAQARLLHAGISAVGDMSLDRSLVPALLELCAEELVELDYQGIMLDEAPSGGFLKYPVLREPGSRHFEIRHWKRYLDGSFGARTAWLRKPYADVTSTQGLSLYKTDELVASAREALRKGFALSFHAIGDAALEQVLELSNALKVEMKDMNDKAGFALHRIEHAQMMGDDQLERLKELGLWTLCLQPHHRVADQAFCETRLGTQRLQHEAYRLGALHAAGLPLSLGSDAPITVFDPAHTLRSALSAPVPGERLDLTTLIWLYTEGGRLQHGLARRELRKDSRVWLLESVKAPSLGELS